MDTPPQDSEEKGAPSAALQESAQASDEKGGPPSCEMQRRHIVRNAKILDRASKLSILRIAKDFEDECPTPGRLVVLPEHKSGVPIHLDNITDPAALLKIYNIVQGRRAALSRPKTADSRRA